MNFKVQVSYDIGVISCFSFGWANKNLVTNDIGNGDLTSNYHESSLPGLKRSLS